MNILKHMNHSFTTEDSVGGGFKQTVTLHESLDNDHVPRALFHTHREVQYTIIEGAEQHAENLIILLDDAKNMIM